MNVMEGKKYVSSPRIVTGWHYEAKCLNCGVVYHAKKSSAKFCSDTCRVMYFHNGKKGVVKTKEPSVTVVKPDEKPLEFGKYDLYEYVLQKYDYNLGYGVGNRIVPRNGELKINTKNGTTLMIKRISHSKYLLSKN